MIGGVVSPDWDDATSKCNLFDILKHEYSSIQELQFLHSSGLIVAKVVHHDLEHHPQGGPGHHREGVACPLLAGNNGDHPLLIQLEAWMMDFV